jgi:hypothetical protein
MLAPSPSPSASEQQCRRALIERYLPASTDVPPVSSMSVPEWVALVTSRLTAAQACAVVEHLFGVLPLMACFDRVDDTLAALASGAKLGALALFTPNPECAWGAVSLTGEWRAGALRLRGEVRLPDPAVDGAIVPVSLSGTEQRLVWLDLGADGVDRCDTRGDRRATSAVSPCWLRIDGASIESAAISHPITFARASDERQQLDAYAGVWALAAIKIATRIVLTLRRAARTTRCHGRSAAFSSSQLVAMTLAEVEIETELVAAAIDRAMSAGEPAIGRMLALSAARVLGSAIETGRQLRDRMGLPFDDWLSDACAPALTMYLGGTPMLENELARALDIGQDTGGTR